MVGKLSFPSILLHKLDNFWVSLTEVLGHNFYYAKNCCLVEISDKFICLFQVSEVIASWEQTFNLVFNFAQIVDPEVSAKT